MYKYLKSDDGVNLPTPNRKLKNLNLFWILLGSESPEKVVTRCIKGTHPDGGGAVWTIFYFRAYAFALRRGLIEPVEIRILGCEHPETKGRTWNDLGTCKSCGTKL